MGLQMISEYATNLPGLGHTCSAIKNKNKKKYLNHLGCEKAIFVHWSNALVK